MSSKPASFGMGETVLLLLFTSCAALFDDGFIDNTCEDLGTCDTAQSDTGPEPIDTAEADSGAHADTGDTAATFEPNRYHVRLAVRLVDGKVVTDFNRPHQVEFHAFSQTEGVDFNPEQSCVLRLSSPQWTAVNVMSDALVGMRPTQPLWSTSGRCGEMESQDLADVLATFEQYSLFFAFTPLPPEIANLASRRPNPLPEWQLGGFYMKIVDGPEELLISPGAVHGWAPTGEESPDLNAPFSFENLTSAPDGFYESIPLTHHALP